MEVIRKINNNVALCRDGNGKELVAFGKGIGFPPIPYEITDLKLISRTFYDVEPEHMVLIDELPEEIIEMSASIVDYARGELDAELNESIVFSLADHINFALIRYRKKMFVRLPIFMISSIYTRRKWRSESMQWH